MGTATVVQPEKLKNLWYDKQSKFKEMGFHHILKKAGAFRWFSVRAPTIENSETDLTIYC